MTVYFQTIDKTRSPEVITKSPDDVKKELAALKLELEAEKDAKKRFELQRKVKRLERLDAIMEWKWVDEKNKNDVTEVLKWKNADNIKNSDILTLRKKWVDIANLTLIDEKNPDKEIKSSEIQEWNTFIVNFGANTSLRDRTGAGDILPPNIKNITINGVPCERKNTPRPGYYDAKWKYQPIYDGYRIEIIAHWEVTKDDEEANERQWKRERLEDTLENGWKPLTTVQDDVQLEKDVQEELKYRTRYQSMNFDINDIGSWDKWLLNFIGVAEWTWDNYNAIFADGWQNTIKFTEMSLTEILEYQRSYKIWKGSAAIGKYQFMDYTLKDMIKKYDIDPNTKFSAEFQDRLAFLKLNERWLSSFKAGRLSQAEFQMNLAREWASIAKDNSWLSYYHWDSMNNKASRAWVQIASVLDKLYEA